MANISKLILVFGLMIGILPALKAQETPFKVYADSHKARKFCFYPSTLRMLNMAHNPDYYILVNDIEKLLIYTLDSAAKANQSYKAMIATYKKTGFEEYATITGGNSIFLLYGKENKLQNQFVGVMKSEDSFYAFYLRGRVAWQKIPALMKSFNTGDMINIFDLNKHNSGKRPQNK